MTGRREDFDAALAKVFDDARREIVRLTSMRDAAPKRLNHAARHLQLAGNVNQWKETLLDAAASFCFRCALFRVGEDTMTLEAARGFDFDGTGVSIGLKAAPAFQNAIETLDTVVALRTVAEVSEMLAAEGKAYVIPVADGAKARAVLYAEPELDIHALELLAQVAGLTLAKLRAPGANGLLTITPPLDMKWEDLPSDERAAHYRAQRLAAVEVATMRLNLGE